MSNPASCINVASSGDLPAMAHGGRDSPIHRWGMCFRMSIKMSLTCVVAHTIGLCLSGFPQLPSCIEGVPDSPIPLVCLCC